MSFFVHQLVMENSIVYMGIFSTPRFSPMCIYGGDEKPLLANTFYVLLLETIGDPFFIMLSAGTLSGAAALFGWKRGSAIVRDWFVFILYSVSQSNWVATINILRCSTEGSPLVMRMDDRRQNPPASYLASYPYISCDSDAFHLERGFVLGVSIMVACILTVFIATSLREVRREGGHSVWAQPYRAELCYWELVVVVRRLALCVTCGLSTKMWDGTLEALIMIFAISCVLQILFHPFERRQDNDLELLGLSLNFCMIVFASYIGGETTGSHSAFIQGLIWIGSAVYHLYIIFCFFMIVHLRGESLLSISGRFVRYAWYSVFRRKQSSYDEDKELALLGDEAQIEGDDDEVGFCPAASSKVPNSSGADCSGA